MRAGAAGLILRACVRVCVYVCGCVREGCYIVVRVPLGDRAFRPLGFFPHSWWGQGEGGEEREKLRVEGRGTPHFHAGVDFLMTHDQVIGVSGSKADTPLA